MDIPLGLFTLGILIHKYKSEGEIPRNYSVLLLVFIVSGCISAFAPGNFVRRGAGTDLNLLFAIKRTVLVCLKETRTLLKNGAVLAGEVAIFAFGIVQGKNEKIRTIKILPLVLLTGLSLFGAILPVVIGYNGSDIPNRIQFIFDVLFLMYSAAFFIACGAKTGRALHSKSDIFVAGIAFFSILLFVTGLRNCAWYKTLHCIPETKMESQGYKCIMECIENSNERDVIINVYSTKIPQTDVIHPPEITGNEQDWVNVSVAGYYNKNTVRLEWK